MEREEKILKILKITYNIFFTIAIVGFIYGTFSTKGVTSLVNLLMFVSLVNAKCVSRIEDRLRHIENKLDKIINN